MCLKILIGKFPGHTDFWKTHPGLSPKRISFPDIGLTLDPIKSGSKCSKFWVLVLVSNFFPMKTNGVKWKKV